MKCPKCGNHEYGDLLPIMWMGLGINKFKCYSCYKLFSKDEADMSHDVVDFFKLPKPYFDPKPFLDFSSHWSLKPTFITCSSKSKIPAFNWYSYPIDDTPKFVPMPSIKTLNDCVRDIWNW